MAWARIDDNFFSHPKVRKAGKDAVMLYMAALCHCNAYLTEGFIADEVLELIGVQAFQTQPKKLAEQLVECELINRVEGGYQIHDYLKYNYSRDKVEELRIKRSEAGSKGGRPVNQNETKMKPNQNQTINQNETKMKPNQNQNETHTHTHINTHPLKELKESTTTTARDEISEIATVYEQEIGALTPIITNDILAVIDDYPLEWFTEAFREAARNNKRSWSYAEAILKRWKTDGFQIDKRIKRDNNRKPTKSLSAGLDEILADAPIFAEDK